MGLGCKVSGLVGRCWSCTRVWVVYGIVWGSHGRTYAKSKNFRNGGAAFLDVFATALALQECKVEKFLTSARHSLNEFTTNLARPMIACALKMYTWQYAYVF